MTSKQTPSREQSILRAVRGYYNSPQTVQKFSRWGADAKRPGVSAHHLGLGDVKRFHGNRFRRLLDFARHKRAVERMTRLIIAESQVENVQSILDAGCGTGSIAFPIAELNSRSHVYGISLSRSQLEVAAKYKQSAGIRNAYFCEQNFTSMAFRDKMFDRVIFAESFCHAPDKRATVEDVGRVLKPGGKVIIVDPLYLEPPPREQEPLREALGSTDGLAMADLPTVEQLEEFITQAGMKVERVLDLTGRAKASLALIANGYMEALVEGRTQPSPLIDSYFAWHMLTDQGPLGYVVVRAVKPG